MMYKYKFICTINSVSTEVFPLGTPNLSFKYNKSKDERFYIRSLEGSLVFTNRITEGVTDYTYFKNIEDNNQCDLITLYIYRSCDNGVTYSIYPYFTGQFGTIDGDWDLDGCKFFVEVNSNENYECLLTDEQINILGTSPTVTTFYSAGSNPDRNYTRSRLFSDMVLYVANQTCSDITMIVSDFFQINPITSSLYNYVTGELNKYTTMTVSAKSDVKEPIPSDAATMENISFKQLMLELKYYFNVHWVIEGDSVRIEHQSYFETTSSGLDLTQSQYDKYMSGTNKYTYDRSDSPSQEQWTNNDGVALASLVNIFYDNACGSKKATESLKTYNVIILFTSLVTLRFNPTIITNLKGIVLFSTTYNAGTGKYDVNGNNDDLVLGGLILKFQRHGRPQLTGQIDYPSLDDFFIFSALKNLKQKPFSIPFCCDDELDTSKYVLTDLGKGDIDDASYAIKNNLLTLSLAYGEDPEPEIEPSDISGLQLWLDANVGVTESGGFVTSWADQSGNGYNATQGTVAKQPTKVSSVINGLPVIRFDGSNDALSTPSFASFPSKRGSVFVVFKDFQPIITPTGQIIGTYGSGAGNMWDISTADLAAGCTLNYRIITSVVEVVALSDKVIGSTASDIICPPNLTSYNFDGFILLEVIRNADTSIDVYTQGGYEGAPITIANLQPTANPVNIGNNLIAGNGNPYKGDIAEIIMYDRDLTDSERQQIEFYFSLKYGIVLFV